MKKDDKIWAAVNDAGEDLFLLPEWLTATVSLRELPAPAKQ